ncbi:MAG: hypothetical protein QOI74_692 [Micromonosporaceae bacterium]|nr:hypothetical protein [Micromonosporaceae bacterium]
MTVGWTPLQAILSFGIALDIDPPLGCRAGPDGMSYPVLDGAAGVDGATGVDDAGNGAFPGPPGRCLPGPGNLPMRPGAIPP